MNVARFYRPTAFQIERYSPHSSQTDIEKMAGVDIASKSDTFFQSNDLSAIQVHDDQDVSTRLLERVNQYQISRPTPSGPGILGLCCAPLWSTNGGPK